MPPGYGRRGTIVAERENTVGVRIDDQPVAILIRKTHIAVMSTPPEAG